MRRDIRTNLIKAQLAPTSNENARQNNRTAPMFLFTLGRSPVMGSLRLRRHGHPIELSSRRVPGLPFVVEQLNRAVALDRSAR